MIYVRWFSYCFRQLCCHWVEVLSVFVGIFVCTLAALFDPSTNISLPRLEFLIASHNRLSQIHWQSLQHMGDKLYGLDISSNLLSGPVPTELGHVRFVNYLSIAGNLFSGTLPSELGILTGLRVRSTTTCMLSSESCGAVFMQLLELQGV